MYYTYAITGLMLLISFIINKQKTIKAIKISFIKFYLGNSSKFISVLLASFIGSITLMPGFVAFPLSGILLTKGVPYMVLSAFTTTLMMVGIITFPLEKEYFGVKATVIRNIISFFIALIVAVITGILFGEIF